MWVGQCNFHGPQTKPTTGGFNRRDPLRLLHHLLLRLATVSPISQNGMPNLLHVLSELMTTPRNRPQIDQSQPAFLSHRTDMSHGPEQTLGRLATEWSVHDTPIFLVRWQCKFSQHNGPVAFVTLPLSKARLECRLGALCLGHHENAARGRIQAVGGTRLAQGSVALRQTVATVGGAVVVSVGVVFGSQGQHQVAANERGFRAHDGHALWLVNHGQKVVLVNHSQRSRPDIRIVRRVYFCAAVVFIFKFVIVVAAAAVFTIFSSLFS